MHTMLVASKFLYQSCVLLIVSYSTQRNLHDDTPDRAKSFNVSRLGGSSAPY